MQFLQIAFNNMLATFDTLLNKNISSHGAIDPLISLKYYEFQCILQNVFWDIRDMWETCGCTTQPSNKYFIVKYDDTQ